MSSNENLPSLLLSDIMHPMSPSPAPLEDQVPAPRQSRYDPDAQQEPLTSSEVLNIRNRLQELGVVMSYGSENEDLPTPRLGITNHLNLREKELTEMVFTTFDLHQFHKDRVSRSYGLPAALRLIMRSWRSKPLPF